MSNKDFHALGSVEFLLNQLANKYREVCENNEHINEVEISEEEFKEIIDQLESYMYLMANIYIYKNEIYNQKLYGVYDVLEELEPCYKLPKRKYFE